MKLYSVQLDCVWKYSDDGDGLHQVMGIYTEKVLAIDAIIDAVFEYLDFLVSIEAISNEEKYSYRDMFIREDIPKLKDGKRIDITFSGDTIWGDYQYISIDEFEANKDFVLDQRP